MVNMRPGLSLGVGVVHPEVVRRYRDRAEELRTKAEEFAPENRDMLLHMAEYYDHFAEQIAQGLWDSRYVRS